MAVTEILLSILLALAAVIYYIARRNFTYWQRRGIPCDPPDWLHGNLKEVSKTSTFGQAFTKIYRRFLGTGPFCGFYYFQKPSVMILTPDLMKQVLIKDFSNFTDRGSYSNTKDDPLSGHLFALDGQKWRIMRAKLSPTFTSGQMKHMFPMIVAVAERLVATLNDELKKSDVIEIKDINARFTTDVIGSCAFGLECDSLKDPNAVFRRIGRSIHTNRRHSNLVMGLIQASPKLALKLGMRIFPDEITDFFINLVRDTVEYREKNNVLRKDFVNILMELNKGKLKFDGSNDEKGLTLGEMAAQAFLFFAGGFDTSSSTLSFLLYELARHKDIQQRLRKEIVETLAKNDNEVTYECTNSMPYMTQVIAETLRIYPILPHLQRVALSDYVVPNHPNYVIEKGMTVFVPIMGIHQNPEIYPEPEKFNPDRFSPEEKEARDSIYWLPFGDGSRNCIGMRFAQMQMRIALIYLLRTFEFSTCALTEIPLKLDPKQFLTGSANGIHLKLKRI